LGALTTLVPLSVVEAALAQHRVVTQRHRRLPLSSLVYLLLAMALFPSESYRELQTRAAGIWEVCGAGPWRRLTSSAISHARARLPWQVMATLFGSLALPGLGGGDGRWRGLRLMALDGSSMEMAVSGQNEAAFGGPTGEGGCRVGDAQLRIVALIDCWTRAALGVAVAEFSRGESRLAVEVVDKLGSDMLLLADRGFVGVELLHLIRQTGSEVLWRVKKGIASRPLSILPDGSYLASMRAQCNHGRGWITGRRPPPIAVRVIEFKLNGQLHRLLTSLLDPAQAPASELVQLYTQRWQIETFYRECKGDEHGRRRTLRSRTANGVRQEIWATLICHVLTRTLICWIVDHSQDVDDPRTVSFTQTTAFIRSHLGPGLRLTRTRLVRWAVAILAQTSCLLRPPPTPRSYPRQVKAKSRRYTARTSTYSALAAFGPNSIQLTPCLIAA